jgi:hypothetical protein
MVKNQQRTAIGGIALLSGTFVVAAWAQGLAGRQQEYLLEPELLTLRVNQEQYRPQESGNIKPGGFFKVRALPKVKFKSGEKVEFTWKFEDSQGRFRGIPKVGDDGNVQLTATITQIYIMRPNFKLTNQPGEISSSGKDVQWVKPEQPVHVNEAVIVAHNWLPARPGNDRPVDEAILQVKVTQAAD